jgi:hypothetical protein
MGMMIIGQSSKPFGPDVTEAVKRAIAAVDGIAEAHFPELYMASQMPGPEQTLIIIPGALQDGDAIMQSLMRAIQNELPQGPQFPAMCVRGNESMAKDVREAGCQIFQSETYVAETKKRWQFWK